MDANTREYAVFRSDDGNRFVFPGIYECLEDGRSINFMQCMTLSMLLKVEREANFVALPDPTGGFVIPHIVSSAGHPNFAHGSETVWIIGGPLFDEVLSEEAA